MARKLNTLASPRTSTISTKRTIRISFGRTYALPNYNSVRLGAEMEFEYDEKKSFQENYSEGISILREATNQVYLENYSTSARAKHRDDSSAKEELLKVFELPK